MRRDVTVVLFDVWARPTEDYAPRDRPRTRTLHGARHLPPGAVFSRACGCHVMPERVRFPGVVARGCCRVLCRRLR